MMIKFKDIFIWLQYYDGRQDARYFQQVKHHQQQQQQMAAAQQSMYNSTGFKSGHMEVRPHQDDYDHQLMLVLKG